MAGDGVEAVTGAGGLSRRSVLGGAGKVAAAGAALTAAGAIVTPELAAAGKPSVGVAAKGTTCIEFVAQINQSGLDFVAYGYLLAVAGLDASDLFSGAVHSEATALLGAYATGQLTDRAVNGPVHTLDIVGELACYALAHPGASFGTPGSFKNGSRVARYALTIQDILTVIAPNTGVPTLIGDLRQTNADAIGPGKPRFGQVGAKLRLLATGIGTRQPPDPPVATLSISGNLTSV